VRIYSSETGEWVRKDSAWSYRIAYAGENAYLSSDWSYRLAYVGRHAYLNGFLQHRRSVAAPTALRGHRLCRRRRS
jgi:hypothetical protein